MKLTQAQADELRELRREIEAAIVIVDAGLLKPMTDLETMDHDARYGRRSFVIGDFVIRRRKYDTHQERVR